MKDRARPAQADRSSRQSATGGPRAASASPPAYGIPFLDHGGPNRTGLPDRLKSGIERLSGYSMDDVRVHHQSEQPARLGALAYTQGTDIHIAPGQERHLPHEAWHVVQQKQGRVAATRQMKGTSLNDDAGLEREADVMGQRAAKGDSPWAPAGQSPAVPPRAKSLSGGDQCIQRKIGFEFEDNQWRPYVEDLGNPVPRPAARKELLHQGHRFKLEGDDTLGAAKPNLEFVTDAYDIDNGGLADLRQSLTEIKAIMSRLSHFVGDEDQQLTNQTFVQPVQHQLSNPAVRLIGGHATGKFKMQATQGVSLEDLPTLMEYFGTHVPGETQKQAKKRKPARKLAHGNVTGTPVSDLLGLLPSLAQEAIRHVESNQAVYGYSIPEQSFFQGPQPRLLGFFAQLIMYVKGLTIASAGAYEKYRIPLLGRIEMSTLFNQLDPTHRRVLAANHAQALIGAVVHAANHQSVLPKPAHIGGFWDSGFVATGPLLRSAHIMVPHAVVPAVPVKLPVMQSLTIGDWLRGITSGHDYLTPAQMDQWLTANEAALSAAERGQRVGLLESFNTLGGAMDPADRMGTSGLNILENRFIAPGMGTARNGFFTPAQFEKAALAYFKFMVKIKTKVGQPGTFPT